MQIRCKSCGAFFEDTNKFCTKCGAANNKNDARGADAFPKTIQGLKDYASANNLPLRKMRFFVGEDFKQPKAFGIFEKDGVFTVYKNKANGERAIRYKGTDEAYAVNELYQKMHSEIMIRKEKLNGQKGQTQTSFKGNGLSGYTMRKGQNKGCIWSLLLAVIFVIFSIAYTNSNCTGSSNSSRSGYSYGSTPDSSSYALRGYYLYNDMEYYYQDYLWYVYDGASGWKHTSPESDLTDNWMNYYDRLTYQSGSSYSDFSKSDYFHDYGGGSYDRSNGRYRSDNDYWDSGDSWDIGDTDWDSDW